MSSTSRMELSAPIHVSRTRSPRFVRCVAALAALAAPQVAAAQSATQPVAVRVLQPARHDFARDSAQPATAEAFYEADLGAKVSGHVSELRVDIGDRVKAGQPLARIAVPELAQARNAAAADVAALRSAYDRTAELAQRNSVTQRALMEAKSKLDAAIAREAEAAADLDYAVIQAPFDGVVTLRTIDPGDMVYQASSPKGRAEPLLRVAKLDVIRVKTYVPERDTIWVNPGDAATVSFDALPGRSFSAPVARVSGVLDPGTRTMLVEIDLPNADGQIRPGFYGQTRIALERHEGALALPPSAVRTDDGGAYVLVVAGETARRKNVRLGLADAQWIEISSGLDEGDRVVATVQPGLSDGAQVRVAP